MQPIFAAPLDATKVYVQSLGRQTHQALVAGLPGAAAEGVTTVCARNSLSGAQSCFGLVGGTFNGVLERTDPGDTVSIWALPGGPGINSIDKTVQWWSARYPWNVHALLLTSEGHLYLGAETGLYKIRREDLRRLPLEINPVKFTSRDGLPSNYVSSLADDGGGGVYVGTFGYLSHLTFDSAEQPQVIAYSAADGLPQNQVISALASDRHGGVWIGTFNGIENQSALGHFVPSRGFHHYTVADGLPSDRIYAIDLDPAGGVWIGTEKGLCHITFNTSGDTHFATYDMPRTALPSNYINHIVSDGASGVWIPGGYDLTAHTYTLVHLIERATGPEVTSYTRSGNRIAAMARDGEGGVWLQTGFGATHVEAGAVTFQEYGGGPVNVEAMVFDPLHGLWTGSRDEGTWRLQIVNGAMQATPYVVDNGLRSDNAEIVVPDETGGAWIARGMYGLSRVRFFPSGEARFENWWQDIDQTYPQQPVRWASALASDLQGGAWIGDGQTLLHAEVAPDGSTRFERFEDRGRFSWISSLSADLRTGGVWIGSETGLYRLQPPDRLDEYHHDPEDSNSLPADSVRFVISDGISGVWAATDAGISHVTLSPSGNASFENYSRRALLPGDHVRVMAPDRAGGAWISGSIRRDGNEPFFGRLSYQNGLAIFKRYEGPWDRRGCGISALLSDVGGAWANSCDRVVRLTPEEDGSLGQSTLLSGLQGASSLAYRASGGLFVGTQNGLYLLGASPPGN